VNTLRNKGDWANP